MANLASPKSASISQLGFVASQLSGIVISYGLPDISKSVSLQLAVARKKVNRANKVSFPNHKTKKLQFVNLQYNEDLVGSW